MGKHEQNQSKQTVIALNVYKTFQHSSLCVCVCVCGGKETALQHFSQFDIMELYVVEIHKS